MMANSQPLKPQASPLKMTEGTLLYLDNVTVSFDGFRALNSLSIILKPGEIRTIIGPNGAGKTTMMDVITGKTKTDFGDVYFNGSHDLTKLDETAIVDLGIGRKFQKPTIFEFLTVYDNLELARKTKRTLFNILFDKKTSESHDRIFEILTKINLVDKANKIAGGLSHGQKQWLEIGMLLIQDQTLLLLDEPVAGLTDSETEATTELILDLAHDKSRSIMVVEHDMTFVRSLNTKVTVLHEGSVLSEGSIDTVQNDQRVIEVYLGR